MPVEISFVAETGALVTVMVTLVTSVSVPSVTVYSTTAVPVTPDVGVKVKPFAVISLTVPEPLMSVAPVTVKALSSVSLLVTLFITMGVTELVV